MEKLIPVSTNYSLDINMVPGSVQLVVDVDTREILSVDYERETLMAGQSVVIKVVDNGYVVTCQGSSKIADSAYKMEEIVKEFTIKKESYNVDFEPEQWPDYDIDEIILNAFGGK